MDLAPEEVAGQHDEKHEVAKKENRGYPAYRPAPRLARLRNTDLLLGITLRQVDTLAPGWIGHRLNWI